MITLGSGDRNRERCNRNRTAGHDRNRIQIDRRAGCPDITIKDRVAAIVGNSRKRCRACRIGRRILRDCRKCQCSG